MWETCFCVHFQSHYGRLKPLQSFWYMLYIQSNKHAIILLTQTSALGLFPALLSLLSYTLLPHTLSAMSDCFCPFLPLLWNYSTLHTLCCYLKYSIHMVIHVCVCNSTKSINGRFYVAALTCPYLMHKVSSLFNIRGVFKKHRTLFFPM
jgi:hypothetical protein